MLCAPNYAVWKPINVNVVPSRRGVGQLDIEVCQTAQLGVQHQQQGVGGHVCMRDATLALLTF